MAEDGNLVLDTIDLDDIGASPAVWEKVVRKLRSRLETALDREAAAKPNPGRPTLHRRNRAEYTVNISRLTATTSFESGFARLARSKADGTSDLRRAHC